MHQCFITIAALEPEPMKKTPVKPYVPHVLFPVFVQINNKEFLLQWTYKWPWTLLKKVELRSPQICYILVAKQLIHRPKNEAAPEPEYEENTSEAICSTCSIPTET